MTKQNYKTKISKDGKVAFCSVYLQSWKCDYASSIADRDLASMTERDRNRIAAASQTI